MGVLDRKEKRRETKAREQWLKMKKAVK